MSSIVISGDTSGAVTIAAPAVAGTNTMTLVAGTGTLAPKVLSTAVASTSGTSIDFTNIPSWVTRITVMFSGVSTNGTSDFLIQLGTSGGIVSSGYVSTVANQSGSSVASSTAGFRVTTGQSAADIISGLCTINNIAGTSWVFNGVLKANTTSLRMAAGDAAIGGVTTTVRITTVGGTDTFDAGTINIMYE